MRTGPVLSVIIATISAGGAFGGYMYFKPSNLNDYFKWKGYTLASEKEDDLWRSIYEENKDSFLSDFGSSKEDENNRWKRIRDYCIRALKKSDYSPEINKATKWCLDNVKTVKGQLIRNKVDLNNLMKTQAQYQVATAVQGNPKFWELLEVADKGFKEKTEAYEKWCNDSMDLDPKSSLVANITTFCRKKDYSDFSQKLNFDKLKRIDKKQIKAKFDKDFKDFNKNSKSTLLETIVGGEESWKNLAAQAGDKLTTEVFEPKFMQAYEIYCEKAGKNTFDENYEKLYSEYKGICGVEEGKPK